MLGVSQAYTTSSAPRLVFWGRFVVCRSAVLAVCTTVCGPERVGEDPNAKAKGGLSKAKGPGSAGEHLFWIHTQSPPPDFGLSDCDPKG